MSSPDAPSELQARLLSAPSTASPLGWMRTFQTFTTKKELFVPRLPSLTSLSPASLPQPRKKYPCIPLSQSDFRSHPWPLPSLVPQTQCISNSALSCPQVPPLTPACREPGHPTASAQQTVCRSSLPASPLPLPSGLQTASCV